MLLYGLMLSFLYLDDMTPRLVEAHPLEPASATVQGQTYTYRDRNMECNVTYLPYADLLEEIVELGAPQSMLEQPEIHDQLKQTVAFRISWRNLGHDVLTFNPDQITLNEKGSGPCATMLDVAEFWPPALVYSEANRLNFAKAFTRGTVTLQPQASHQQLVVFTRYQKKLPKKVELRLERIYYGIEVMSFASGYRVRYPK